MGRPLNQSGSSLAIAAKAYTTPTWNRSAVRAHAGTGRSRPRRHASSDQVRCAGTTASRNASRHIRYTWLRYRDCSSRKTKVSNTKVLQAATRYHAPTATSAPASARRAKWTTMPSPGHARTQGANRYVNWTSGTR